ncbi:GH23710 [Drosophila grimshawi]|uniref:GH23710 n=1 Tax=Drosophila grimshawi TaxID=7222 RepID=B4K307_DROGR|nr:GH23710 [Drosophila grimshawi]
MILNTAPTTPTTTTMTTNIPLSYLQQAMAPTTTKYVAKATTLTLAVAVAVAVTVPLDCAPSFNSRIQQQQQQQQQQMLNSSNPMSSRNFPPSFWNSNYVHPIPAPTHPQVSVCVCVHRQRKTD